MAHQCVLILRRLVNPTNRKALLPPPLIPQRQSPFPQGIPLILVLLEVGLGEAAKRAKRIKVVVLILVLLEVGLGEQQELTIQDRIKKS